MLRNATYAVRESLRKVVFEGEVVLVKSQERKEVRSHLIQIASPLERVCICPHQNSNIFIQISETFKALAGSSKQFNFISGNELNQLKEVAEHLRKAPSDRSVVVPVVTGLSNDTKSTNYIHFVISNNRLNLNIFSPANDILAFANNSAFSWSIFQEIVAYWTETQVGDFSQFSSLLYVNKVDYQQAEVLLAHSPDRSLYEFGFEAVPFTTPIDKFEDAIATFTVLESRMRHGETEVRGEIEQVSDRFLKNSLELLYIYYRSLQNADEEEIASLLESLPINDLKIGAIEYFYRQLKNPEIIKLQPQEQEYFNYLWKNEQRADLVDRFSLTSPTTPIASKFAGIFAQLCILHYKKSLIYKNSWKRHGELLGVFGNMVRKYDRIETLIIDRLKPTTDETLLDTLADMAVYATKYLTYLAENYQSLFKDFIEQYPPVEPLEHYLPNEGFDAVAKILIRRYQNAEKWQTLSEYKDCFEEIKQSYKGLEQLLMQGDWRASDPRKCSLTADLVTSCMHYLVLASTKEPDNFQKLLQYIEVI